MDRIPRVALLVETSRAYGRGLLRGIVRYARLHGPWSFYVTPGDFVQALPKMREWGGVGIIARIETPRVAKAIAESGLPTIGLDLREQEPGSGPLANVSEIHPDPAAAARMAFDHLVGRGFRRFAFVGVPGRIWSQQRQEAFAACAHNAGVEYLTYKPPRHARDREWGREQAILAQWLTALPKPIGLFACNDDRGRQVLEACLAAQVRAPEEVAVIGMDDDDLLCELCDPPLSSVALNLERGGFEAAALLDRLMAGEIKGPQRLLVEPLWVTTRLSTDVVAVDDVDVATALRFIREHAAQPIQVSDVLQAAPLSRRSLEMRLRAATGRSLHDEIQRVHLERAKRLLAETDSPVERVAEASGFNSASYMGAVFRRETGMTPAAYRTHVRAR